MKEKLYVESIKGRRQDIFEMLVVSSGAVFTSTLQLAINNIENK